MSQLWLRETNELAQRSKTNSLVRLIFRCGSLDLRPWPFLLQHDSSTVKKPAKRQGSHTEKFSVFAFPLPSSFCQVGAGCIPDPWTSPRAPSRSHVYISKWSLFSPTAGRILNKPKKPLGGLPACAPPVSILVTQPQGGATGPAAFLSQLSVARTPQAQLA